MDLEQRLRASFVAPDPGALFTARVMARVERRGARRRSSVILMGTVLLVAAAAAMLGWQWFDPQPVRVESVTIAAAPVPESAADESVADAPVVHVMPAVGGQEAEVPEPVPPAETAPRFSVLVMPLRQEVQDAARHQPVEALYAALLEALREVPGLTLQEVEGPADFVLTLTKLVTTAAPSGGVEFHSSDGYRYRVKGDSRLTSVDINLGPDQLRDGRSVNFFSGAAASMSAVSADGGVVSFDGSSAGSAAHVSWVELRVEPRQLRASRYTFPVGPDGAGGLAAAQVAMLRLQQFPADAGFQQRVIARMSDPGQGGARVLQDLLPLLTADGGKRLAPATIRALFRHAANQSADTRARFWRALSLVNHPTLREPLVESLRRDADQQVRLAALANLEAHFAADPAVRSTLEGIDREDGDPVVRAAVRWVLYGEAQWRSDVLAALQDASLSYGARLTPLIVRTPADYSARQSGRMSLLRRELLQEDQVLRAVTTLVRENLRDSTTAQVTGEVLGLLANVDDPAVVDLFLQLTRETALPIQMSGPVGTWAINHRNDPRVRESLPQVQPAFPAALLERMKEIEGTSGTY